MLACDCLVAAVLLTASPDVPMPDTALGWAEACRTSILALALDAQLLDPREDLNYLSVSQDAATDLRALQKRYRQFAFAPLAEEGLRFPDRNTVLDFLAFNDGYRQDLQARLEIDPVHGAHLRVALDEANRLHKIWSVVAECRRGCLYITTRRECLQELQSLLGAEAFYRGQLPPYVPVWRLPVAR